MKPFLWMTCAVLAACAIGFSAYRMLMGEASERIPATRLVIEADASYLSTMGMVPLEDPFIFDTAHSPAFELREGKSRLTLAECILEARQKNVLDGVLDRIDPQRSLRLYVICRVSGEIKEAWLDDEGNGEDTALLRRAVAVLGCYWLLRNFCDDEELFFRWMRLSLKSRKAEVLDASVEYLFPWLKPDREQYVHGRWISDIESVTYDCLRPGSNAGAAVSWPCLFTVSSRKNGSSGLLEIRCPALKGALLTLEIPLDNRTLHPRELLPFRIWEDGHGWPYPWNVRPVGVPPVWVPPMKIPEDAPSSSLPSIPGDFRSCPEEDMLPELE